VLLVRSRAPPGGAGVFAGPSASAVAAALPRCRAARERHAYKKATAARILGSTDGTPAVSVDTYGAAPADADPLGPRLRVRREDSTAAAGVVRHLHDDRRGGEVRGAPPLALRERGAAVPVLAGTAAAAASADRVRRRLHLGRRGVAGPKGGEEVRQQRHERARVAGPVGSGGGEAEGRLRRWAARTSANTRIVFDDDGAERPSLLSVGDAPVAAPEALVASCAEYLATVRARLGVNAEWSKVDERERVRERRRKKRKGGGDDDNAEDVERDAAPAVMLARGSDDDGDDGIGRDGVASDGKNLLRS